MTTIIKEFEEIYQDIFKDEIKFQNELSKLFERIISKIIDLEKNELSLSKDDILKEIKPFFDNNPCIYSQMDLFFGNLNTSLKKQFGDKYNKKQIEQINDYDEKIINSSVMNLYFKEINRYFKKDFAIFGLGDSLNKFDMMWNSLNESNQIVNIPFSGSFFDDPVNFHSMTPILNQKKFDDMIQKIGILYKNNQNFKRMIDLIKDGKQVLITDYGNFGGATITILILLSNIPEISEKLRNVKILLLTFNDDILDFISENIEILDKDKILDLSKILDVKFLDNVFSRYYTNSEDSNSRCVPKYGYKLWNNIPDKMYRDGLNYNYFGCYLSIYIHFIYNYCYYIQVIQPNILSMDDTDKNLYKISNEQTNSFFTEKYLNEFKIFVKKIDDLLNILERYVNSNKISEDDFMKISHTYILNLFNSIREFKGISGKYLNILRDIMEKFKLIHQNLISKSNTNITKLKHKEREIEEIDKKYYKYKLKYLKLKKLLKNQRF